MSARTGSSSLLLVLVVAFAIGAVIAFAGGPGASPARAAPRVIGGDRPSQPEFDARWRSVVSLRWTSGNGTRPHSCGGVLIDTRWVLTARHCIESGGWTANKISELRVRGAARTLTGPAPVATVGAIYRSPSAAGRWFSDGGDIALLRLRADLPGAVPAPFARPEHAAWWGAGGGRADGVAVAGWGIARDASVRLEREFGPIVDQLRVAQVPVLADDACASAVPKDPSVRRHICAGAPDDLATSVNEGRSSCYGDSGGPLLANDPAGIEPPRIVGIVSRGTHDQCSAGPTIYVRVADHAGWIDAVLATWATPTLRSTVNVDVSDSDAWSRVVVRLGQPTPSDEHFIFEVRPADSESWLELGRFQAQRRAFNLPPTRRGSTFIRIRHVVAGVEMPSSVGSWSKATYRDTTPPTAPRRLTTRRTGVQHQLAWTPARDRDDRVVGYYIEQRVPGARGWKPEAYAECEKCWTSLRARPITRSTHILLPGRRQFRIAARDRAGNWSAWTYGHSLR